MLLLYLLVLDNDKRSSILHLKNHLQVALVYHSHDGVVYLLAVCVGYSSPR